MRYFTVILLFMVVILTSSNSPSSYSKKDMAIINNNSDSLLRVLTIKNPQDSLILRAKSSRLSRRFIKSRNYKILSERMIRTVSDSTVDGVGIAAPQIGINKRIVVVQRYDLPFTPFIAYPNIYIVERSNIMVIGPEGCLSVPGRRGEVTRSQSITIRYTDPVTLKNREEKVNGYSAIIFQHEVDHLDGVLYIDYL